MKQQILNNNAVNRILEDVLLILESGNIDYNVTNLIFSQIAAVLKDVSDDVDIEKLYPKMKHKLEKLCRDDEQRTYFNLGKTVGFLNNYYNIQRNERKFKKINEKIFKERVALEILLSLDGETHLTVDTLKKNLYRYTPKMIDNAIDILYDHNLINEYCLKDGEFYTLTNDGSMFVCKFRNIQNYYGTEFYLKYKWNNENVPQYWNREVYMSGNEERDFVTKNNYLPISTSDKIENKTNNRRGFLCIVQVKE